MDQSVFFRFQYGQATPNDILKELFLISLTSIVARETPSIIEQLVYVWHEESLDALDDHFGSICHFRDGRESPWVTTITLLHWSLDLREIHPTDQTKGTKKTRFLASLREKLADQAVELRTPKEPRAAFVFPPEDIDKFLGPEHWADEFGIEEEQLNRVRPHLELNSSSIIISTAPFGDFGKCSVLSRVVTEATHLSLEKSALEISNAFIHQPHSSRCLIFIIYLGAVCDGIASQYERILQCLDEPLGLGVRLC